MADGAGQKAGRHRGYGAWLGTVLILIAGTGYAVNIVLARLTYEGGGNTITLLSVRILFFCLAVFLFCRLKGRPLALPPREARASLALGLIIGGHGFAYYHSVNYIPVSIAVLIFYTFPLIVAVSLRVFAREPLTPLTVGALVVAFAGLALALGVTIEDLDWRGIALAACGAVGLAVTVMVSNLILRTADAVRMSFHLSLTIAVAFTIALVVSGDFALPGTPLGRAAFAAVPPVYVLAVLSFYAAIPMIGPVRVALFSNMEPVMTVLLAVAVLGEVLSVLQALGAALVVATLVVVQRARKG